MTERDIEINAMDAARREIGAAIRRERMEMRH